MSDKAREALAGTLAGARRAGSRWSFNTVFARMAIFALLVLFAVQSAWFAVLTIQRPHNQSDGYARGLLLVIQAGHAEAERGASLSSIVGVRLVPVAQEAKTLDPSPRGPVRHLVEQVRAQLPEGSRVAMEPEPNMGLWVLYPGASTWVVTPVNPPPQPRIMLETVAMFLAAIVLSLGAAWQMQRPMSRIAQIALRFGKGERPAPMHEKGPREVRELIHAVNLMMSQISQNEDERALMLAGIAHDLKAPLTRMKLRATVLDDERDRDEFVRDVDSLAHIVQQFLEFAGAEPSDGPSVPVDHFIAAQFAMPETGEGALFVHRLQAGPEFTLPRTLIDRLATNLVDNAFEHGEPPVEICTAREGDCWIFEVRDHGPGISPERVAEAMQPFARLDPARSGDGHCGLGLAIVERLARKRHGHCEISNWGGGGLSVRIVLPVDTPKPGTSANHIGRPATPLAA